MSAVAGGRPGTGLSSLLPRLRELARAALLRSARDHTAAATARSCLIVAPHPDDETLGCGGRILLARRAGQAVTVLVATDGAASHGADLAGLRAVRRQELAAATGLLGLSAPDLITLDLPDGSLAAHRAELVERLVALIDERRPDEVYATCRQEAHPDHAAAGLALAEALSRCRHRPRAFEYPIWLWGDWPISRRWLRRGPGHWLDLLVRRRARTVRLDGVRAAKQAAIDVYRSQLGAEVAGVAVGLPASVLARAAAGPELFFDVSGR